MQLTDSLTDSLRDLGDTALAGGALAPGAAAVVPPAGTRSLEQVSAARRPAMLVQEADAIRGFSAAPVSLSYRIAKRTLDVVFAAVGVVLSAPIMLLLAVTIRLDSPGPIVFRQYRVGQDGRLFAFY